MFRRQIEVLGEENQKKLSQKSILIVGCGGLGNIIATTLGCIGLNKIYLIDFDKIELHNIHRQFQFCKNDIGKFKCEVLKEKIQRCDTEIISLNKKFSTDLDIDIDLIIDATDNFDVRLEIDRFAKKKNIPWIYSSVEEWRAQIGIFKKASFEIFALKNHTPKGQIPPMVNLAGSFAALVALKVLLFDINEKIFYLDFENNLVFKEFSL